MAMDVILLERVHNLGQIGDVVKVRPGYARNYLLPLRKALRATEANKAKFESQRAQIEATNLEKRSEAEKVRDKIANLKVVLIRQAGESGQLFGSVNARDLAEAATAAGFAIERRQIILDRPIKTLGLHPVRVALHPEVVVEITANVAKSTEEAEAQEKAGGYIGRAEEAASADLDAILTEAEAAVAPGEAKGEGESKAEPKAKAKGEAKPKGEAKSRHKAEAKPKGEDKAKSETQTKAKPSARSKKKS
jgi:large subunit ribosomal protein L9